MEFLIVSLRRLISSHKMFVCEYTEYPSNSRLDALLDVLLSLLVKYVLCAKGLTINGSPSLGISSLLWSLVCGGGADLEEFPTMPTPHGGGF